MAHVRDTGQFEHGNGSRTSVCAEIFWWAEQKRCTHIRKWQVCLCLICCVFLQTVRMTKEIQKIFHELVENATWLDNTTRSLAKIKIDNMCLRIGYPDFVLDVDQLSEMYTDVQIHPDLYFENTLSILKVTLTQCFQLWNACDLAASNQIRTSSNGNSGEQDPVEHRTGRCKRLLQPE